MHRKKDNRGSAMIIVIVVIAFVSILVSTLYTMVTLNIQMKSVDRKAKKSFYSAEGALEQINLGLQEEMSTASEKAYTEVMQSYIAETSEADRRQKFNNSLITEMKTQLKQDSDPTKYKKEKLESYLTSDVRTYTEISSNSWDMTIDIDNSGLVLKGVVITYTDTEGFQSVIETDIHVKAPNLNLIQPSDMPDLFEYSMIANKKLKGIGNTNVNISNNLFVGGGDGDGIGIQMQTNDKWNIDNSSRVVSKGSISVPTLASLKVGDNTDLWTAEVIVNRGSVDLEGKTYVADDLILEGQGSSATLGGAYYGYGNGTTLNSSGDAVGTNGNSSAVLINGTQSTLDMTNLRRLLLSGSAQIATGKTPTNDVANSPAGIKAEFDQGLWSKLDYNVRLASGTYRVKSISRDKLWCSDENFYIVARTDTNAAGNWEKFQLINNSDGTISLMDNNNNHTAQYLSVQETDYRLKASASTIGITEKFTLAYVKDGDADMKYVLKAYVNDKFVTVDSSGNLYANRDKVTGKEQLFDFIGMSTITVETVVEEPIITFTYDNSDYRSNAYITIGTGYWLSSKNPKATLHYKFVYEADSAYRTVEMAVPSNDKYFAYCTIKELWSPIDYYFTYTAKDGKELKTSVQRYTNTRGIGNDSEQGTVSNPKLANGVYSIYSPSNNMYLSTEGDYATPCRFTKDTVGTTDGSWERIVLVNNSDGTVSFWSKITKKYASVQTNGEYANCIIMNADSIGTNERFTLEYSGQESYYRLKFGDKYLYLNTSRDYMPIMVMASGERDISDARLKFNWLEYTYQEGSKIGTSKSAPIYGMSRDESLEDRAVASFRLSNVSYTLSSAKLYYSIDGAAESNVDMSISNGVATAHIDGLGHGAQVNYWISYVCSDGRTRNIAHSLYVHERKYGPSLSVPDHNDNVNLGGSIEVKSNQVAYLVPPECVGVNNGETLFGQNPMSAEDYVKLLAYDADDVNYPDFELVSFTKKIEGLNKTLGDYRTVGQQGYQVVFSQKPGGTSMVYIYVDFDKDNISKYFKEYYETHQIALNSYMNNYVNNIKMSTYFTRLMLNGNMIYSENATPGGKINIRSNEGVGAGLTTQQQEDLKDEETGYLKTYNALFTKLILDYGDLTAEEKSKELFDNIIRDTAFAGISTTGAGTVYSDSYGSETIKAVVINNAVTGVPYVYHGTGDQQNICMILASGDVDLTADYSGIIIAKGTITIKNGVTKIESSKDRLRKILQAKIDPTNPASDTIIKHFFVNGEDYVLETPSISTLVDGDYVDYATCISYENWSKN